MEDIKDCLLHVYSYLPLKDIYQCMQVNELFYNTSQDPYVWLQLLERDYKNEDKKSSENSLYETYKKYKELNDCVERMRSSLINMLEKMKRATDMEIDMLQDLRYLKVDLLS